MTERWITAFEHLGQWMQTESEVREGMIQYAHARNPWFTRENILIALNSISDCLHPEIMNKWLSAYEIPAREPIRVGAILAGNIPTVGFHDMLCILLSGHKAVVKLSEKDNVLLPALFDRITEFDAGLSACWEWVEVMPEVDAVIATGSNQSRHYFEKYFGKYPHIIRSNRNSVAVLTGDETEEELRDLGRDIFTYFGLGCRNVSAIWVPEGYQFDRLLDALNEYKSVMNHQKYRNNFDYNLATLMINRVPYEGNDCILMLEESNLASRIGTLHVSHYANFADLHDMLEGHSNEIQCVVCHKPIDRLQVVEPGKAQCPGLSDYADGVDTMAFLHQL